MQLISIGNGTASRETDKLAGDLIARQPELPLTKVMVSEAGASVYSASELAAKEFPDLDVSLRGAVSIARRLQDPLAELVRIEPKAIGVGQYQHDVSQIQLAKKLDAVVEDCVNAVGADVNTASAPLLARISGLSDALASNIVVVPRRARAVPQPQQLLEGAAPRRAHVSAGGRLPAHHERRQSARRVGGASRGLSASSSASSPRPACRSRELIGKTPVLRALQPEDFADAQFGVPTVKDILAELEKPGRDPRPGVQDRDLQGRRRGAAATSQPGMLLEGVVTNVANFGAFVDIGVHQDGLVHVSQLADRFVKDPREVVKAGDIVKVQGGRSRPQAQAHRADDEKRSGSGGTKIRRRTEAGRGPEARAAAKAGDDAEHRV